jgi:hypothetical protein
MSSTDDGEGNVTLASKTAVDDGEGNVTLI